MTFRQQSMTAIEYFYLCVEGFQSVSISNHHLILLSNQFLTKLLVEINDAGIHYFKSMEAISWKRALN